MGILDDLPGEIQFTATLAPVIGDATAGTGLAGVLKLLESLDPASVSSFLASQLDGSLDASLSVSESGLTGDVAAQFERAVQLFQRDPLELALPLVYQLESLQNVARIELPGRLTAKVDGLNAMAAIVPPDGASLVAGAAGTLEGVKQAALTGPLDELRQWSLIGGAIQDEITPLMGGGAGAVADRLIAFLLDFLSELAHDILPDGVDIASALTDRLGAAFTLNQIESINAAKLELIGHLEQARVLFDAGNFTDTSHLAAAQARLEQLGSLLGGVAGSLNDALSIDSVAAGGLTSAVARQLDHLDEFEFIDLARIDTKLKEAVASIEAAVQPLDLDALRAQVTALLDRLHALVADTGLANLTAELTELQSSLRATVATLDGALLEAIAAIQGIFRQAAAGLAEITSALGTVENGEFRFQVQTELDDFLTGIKTTMSTAVQPALEAFETTIGDVIDQIATQLTTVQDAVESVTTELQAMMQGVITQLHSLDIPGSMTEIRGQLDTMNASLGAIDFSIVVDPVIAEIESMRDTLARIDVSAMNEITVGALKVSVEVVTNIDFSTQITDALMAELDEILNVPTGLIGQIEGEVITAVARLADFGPEAIVAPVQSLFQPIETGVNALSLEPLLEPIEAWHQKAVTEVTAVTPSALMQPVVAQYDTLATAVASVDPAALIKPLGDAIAALRAELSGPQLKEPLSGLTGLVSRVRELVASLDPAHLLAPLIEAFDTVMAALAELRPTTLLAPVAEIFDLITAPINALNANQTTALRDAFAPIRELTAAFDPRLSFERTRQAFIDSRALLAQLNLGGLLAEIKGPYDALSLSFQAGDPGNAGLSASVTALNPLQDPSLGQAIASLSQSRARLDAALAEAAPPAELVIRFDAAKGKLEALVPGWAEADMTVAQTKQAIKATNPLSVMDALDSIYNAMIDKLNALDPRLLETELAETFAPLNDLFAALDPEPLVIGIQETLVAIVQKLETLALQTIVDEAQSAFAEVQDATVALDPRPVIAALDGLTAEVTGMLDALQPAPVLASIAAPAETAREIVLNFNPSIFKEPLAASHAELQEIIAQIDIDALLEPLLARLKQLRDALEAALRSTEAAFNDMLAAIPV